MFNTFIKQVYRIITAAVYCLFLLLRYTAHKIKSRNAWYNTSAYGLLSVDVLLVDTLKTKPTLKSSSRHLKNLNRLTSKANLSLICSYVFSKLNHNICKKGFNRRTLCSFTKFSQNKNVCFFSKQPKLPYESHLSRHTSEHMKKIVKNQKLGRKAAKMTKN